jgi:hypothetical protein
MYAYERDALLAELYQAETRVAHSKARVAAQEKRIGEAKHRGDDTAGSEGFLATLRDSLRLHQEHHRRLLLDLGR